MANNEPKKQEVLRTREQRMAEVACRCVEKRTGKDAGDYLSFANSFPSLVHSCGLVQAVAFAKAKGKAEILEDISSVLGKPLDELTVQARSKPLAAYMLLSREVLAAAGWVKRYAQALLKEEGRAENNG